MNREANLMLQELVAEHGQDEVLRRLLACCIDIQLEHGKKRFTKGDFVARLNRVESFDIATGVAVMVFDISMDGCPPKETNNG